MPILPAKLQQGQLFKQSAVKKINEIIDYLKSQRIISDNKTIRINQLTNGVALTALSQQSSKGSSVHADTDHPFKLKISTLEEAPEGSTPTPVLKITQTRIILDGKEAQRIYFCYDDNDSGLPTHLPLPKEIGKYDVVGYCVCDPTVEQSDDKYFNGLGWITRCNYFNQESGTTAEIMMSKGFFTFIIGTISVEQTEDGSLSYSVIRQLLYSPLSITDGDLKQPFIGHWRRKNYPPDGTIITEILADEFVISQGYLFIDSKYIPIKEYVDSEVTDEDKLYCLKVPADGSGASIQKKGFHEWIYFDTQKKQYYLPICLTFKSDASGRGIIQFIQNAVFLNFAGKVKLNTNDQVPSEYLNDKIKYPITLSSTLDKDQKAFYGEGTKSYIRGIQKEKQIQAEEGEVKKKSLYDDLYWDWPEINKFDKDKNQVLIHQKNNLKWGELSSNIPQVSGSLANFIIVDEGQENEDGEIRPTLKYKPETKNTDPLSATYKFVVEDKSSKITWWYPKDIEEAKNSILTWDYSTNSPKEECPPDDEGSGKKYVLAGSKLSGLSWCPLSGLSGGAGDLSLSGSIQNIFQLVEDEESGKIMRVRTENEDPLESFNFVYLNEIGELQYDTFQGAGVQSLFIWDNEYMQPLTFDAMDYNEDEMYFLAGDKDAGFWWQNIYNYVGTVLVTETDGTDDYLYNKVISTDDSVMVMFDGSSNYEHLDLCVNPDWFFSSDDSVIIEYTEDGYLDLYGAGMVQIHDEDSPGFLYDKVCSDDNSILIQETSISEGEALSLEINPEYFFSSDDSIITTPTDFGLDLQSAGKIKCSEQDTIDYITTKINVDPSIESLITLDKQQNQILIKSAIQGNAVLIVEDGVVKSLSSPTTGKYIFACEDGKFSWKEYTDCENACSDQQQQ